MEKARQLKQQLTFYLSLATTRSVYPHGRKSTVALLLAIGSYLTLNGGMWSCLFMEIDGYLYETEPFVWEDTIKVRGIYTCSVKSWMCSTQTSRLETPFARPLLPGLHPPLT